MEKKRILYVTSELMPYFTESKMATTSLDVAKSMVDAGNDVRVFMPKFGVINERRHQLHEVIRLSGMNIVVNEIDQPLVIKVAAVPGAKLQAYFIDNEDYFNRKALYCDKGIMCEDTDERMQFFARAVLEAVKKLNWSPDIIQINGWFGALIPIYLKSVFKNEALFMDTKIVYTLFNEAHEGELNPLWSKNLVKDGINKTFVKHLEKPNFLNINKIAIEYADGVVFGEEFISDELLEIVQTEKILNFDQIEDGTKEAFLSFYTNQILI